MDNLDDTDNTAKVSDSAYSNSCSNSQSRSNSSKSTHSGSHSSGSSGYGGKPSTSGYSNSIGQPPEKRNKEKDTKKKKHLQTECPVEVQQTVTQCRAPEQLLENEASKEGAKEGGMYSQVHDMGNEVAKKFITDQFGRNEQEILKKA